MSGIGASTWVSFVFEQLGFHDGLILLKDTFHSCNALVFGHQLLKALNVKVSYCLLYLLVVRTLLL